MCAWHICLAYQPGSREEGSTGPFGSGGQAKFLTQRENIVVWALLKRVTESD